MSDPAARLQARAADARARAQLLRRDAVAAAWRAAGARQQARDLRIELVWSVFQNLRVRDGQRLTPGPFRQCEAPGCAGHQRAVAIARQPSSPEDTGDGRTASAPGTRA